jgi:hypothetical protein
VQLSTIGVLRDSAVTVEDLVCRNASSYLDGRRIGDDIVDFQVPDVISRALVAPTISGNLLDASSEAPGTDMRPQLDL